MNHRKYKTTDMFGNKVELQIFSIDKNYIKLKINDADTILHYDKFAEFTSKCNQFIKDKRFK